MRKDLIDRINQMAKKAKEEGLSPEEQLEQKKLRDEYLRIFRQQFKKRLENIEIHYPE